MLHIEAVTVCVGCDDFLKIVAPYNIPHLDRWIIVTEPTDTATREVCRKLSLECLLSEDNKRDGEFSKGRMIERGLRLLSRDCWRLQLDSDIILPSRFQSLLGAAHLQEDTIYGVDRVMVKGWDQWQKMLASNFIQQSHHDFHCRVRWPEGFSVGARWGDQAVGYVPIGFFQLWHAEEDQYKGIRAKPYPFHHGDACRTDVQHALQWDRHKRELIPEIVVVHLESEETSPLGANWKGRKTPRFEAPKPGQKTGQKTGSDQAGKGPIDPDGQDAKKILSQAQAVLAEAQRIAGRHHVPHNPHVPYGD